MPRKSSWSPLLYTFWKPFLAKVYDRDLFALLSSDTNNIALIEEHIKDLYIWLLKTRNNELVAIQSFFKNLIWSICGDFVWSFDNALKSIIAWASLQWKRFLNDSKGKLWALWNIKVWSDDVYALRDILKQLDYSLVFPDEEAPSHDHHHLVREAWQPIQ